MSEMLLLAGLILVAASGFPGLVLSRHALTGQWLSIVLSVVGGGLGLAGLAVFWSPGIGVFCGLAASWPIRLPWAVIDGGGFDVAMDGLSAVFLLPIFLISMLGSIYGLGYWKQTEHAANGRKLRLFYGLITAGMALLVIARNSVLFLFGWELMALSAFFLVTTEDDGAEVRNTGWIYLVATHVATLALFALFALLHKASGSYAIAPLGDDGLTPALARAIFVLALLAFGIKAGIMPLHVWLPGAHAMAPSHVSAMLSGVMIKMGIYGIVRITSLFPHPPLEWGGILLILGTVSGVLGVVFAIGQHDLKRLLAYHSIENIGIIVMGIGLAMLGRSLGRPELVILGLSGALLHVWNHAFFKSLLFFSAGSVVHAVHTRAIDQLGGMARRMPWTALAFLIGAAAICGLPPLNGFVSEFLVYLGLFGTLRAERGHALDAAAFAIPALALIGALALACFVKVYGAVFLGNARGRPAEQARESDRSMLAPMGVLAASCVFIGLAPTCIVPVLQQGVAAWAPELGQAGGAPGTPGSAALAPMASIGLMAVLLAASLLLAGAIFWVWVRHSGWETGPTWACGYVAPTARMQYTASSFAQMMVDLFAWVLRPRVHRPAVSGTLRVPLANGTRPASGYPVPDTAGTPYSGSMDIFPGSQRYESHVPDPVLDEVVVPAFRISGKVLLWFRVFQQGNIQSYLFYIFLALIALLMWR
jgi:hydrogenase-4 component B